MARRGWVGVTLPNLRGGVTIRYWLVALPHNMKHERVHVAQIERMGRLKFLAVYAWLLLRHGYQQHPMEIEAREAE